MGATRPRLLILGIDGLPADMLTRWKPGFRMSCLESDMVSATVRSLDIERPFNSASSWTSFLTGRPPCFHGIYDFNMRDGWTYRHYVADARHIGHPSFMSLLNAAGIRTLMGNVPMTYPASVSTGPILCGPVVPQACASYTNCAEIEAIVRDIEHETDISPSLLGRPCVEEDLVYMRSFARQQCQILSALIERLDWECAAVVVTATDRLFHKYWGYCDPTHRAYSSPLAPTVRHWMRRTLREIDAAVGEMIRKCESDSEVLVVSDHGFGPLDGVFRLPSILVRLGFGDHPATASGREPRSWSRTRVYAAPASSSGVYVNHSARNRAGIVDPTALEALLDEVVQAIRREYPGPRWELSSTSCRGPMSMLGPDMYIRANDGRVICSSRYAGDEGEYVEEELKTGTHDAMGILMAKGDFVCREIERRQSWRIWQLRRVIEAYFGIDSEGASISERDESDVLAAMEGLGYV
ncbi:alkaline phosphatase family protein [bacterium]|nr:alkaline phosphatase family protein [bacterium]